MAGKLNWIGAVALGFGGANLSLYTLSSVVTTQGTFSILIFILAFVLTVFASLGYLELVLMYPQKVGGISVASEKAFRAYSPIITNIAGVGYWLAWLMAGSFAAVYVSTTIQQYFIPNININLFATTLIVVVTFIHLLGLKWVQRCAIPIAAVAALLALVTAIFPIFNGTISLENATSFNLIVPFTTKFGQIASFMAGLYLIGWIVPGYEAIFCYSGDMENPICDLPKSLYLTMFFACLFYVILPLIWLGVLGPTELSKNLLTDSWPVYAPLIEPYAKLLMAWFITFNLLACMFTPFGGPPRTLAQLAKDDLIPLVFQKTSKTGVPWVATILTSFVAIVTVWSGTPTWLIAATNFQYLIAICTASIAVVLLRFHEPEAYRPYKAPNIAIIFSIVSAAVWLLATILGFEQYGLSTMICGISFAFIGMPLYMIRRYNIRKEQGLKFLATSLNIKLTGCLFAVLVIDAIGYLVAVNTIDSSQSQLVYVLGDIFVIVALFTLSAGLIIPGSIVYATNQVSAAAKRLINVNLRELAQAMDALGSGNLKEAVVTEDIQPVMVTSRDEIGEMAQDFNNMQKVLKQTSLSFNEVRDRLIKYMQDLTDLNTSLEKRVEERTLKLKDSNKKLQNEITEKTHAETRVAELNTQLLTAARRAGMADIASSTLHNIGNVLNSVNTSCTLLYDKIYNSRMNNLDAIVKMFESHKTDLANFLTTDEKGKLIPEYVTKLAQEWHEEKSHAITEIKDLENNIQHIHKIIKMEQSLSESLGTTEKINFSEVIDEALTLNKNAIEKNNVVIINNVKEIRPVIIDKIRLLQIIVNLVKNSVESLRDSTQTTKRLIINVEKIDDNFFQLEITDNGLGISKENLHNIFSSGFTTKKTGHGFGLHSSCIAAQEMGGNLKVKSDGLNKGATFILTLPYEVIVNEPEIV